MNRSHQRTHVSRGSRNERRRDPRRVDKNRAWSPTTKKQMKKTRTRKSRQRLKHVVEDGQ